MKIKTPERTASYPYDWDPKDMTPWEFLQWAAIQSRTGMHGVDGACIIWPFYVNDLGYANIDSPFGKSAAAVGLMLAGSMPPSPDHVVRHDCDNRDCVNYLHKHWGEQPPSIVKMRRAKALAQKAAGSESPQ